MTFLEIQHTLNDREDKQEFRNKIVSACEIQQSTYYSWLRRGKIPRKAQKKISELLNVPETELFPKEKSVLTIKN
jgi:hypothetical protein